MIKEELVVKDNDDRVRVNFWVSKKIHDYINHVANRDDRSVSEVVRDALRQFINEDKKKNGVADGGGNG